MTTTWTLYDPSGADITPTPPPTGALSLTYDSQGLVRDAVGQVVDLCECISDDATVTVVLSQGTHSNTLDPGCTQVTKAPTTIPDAGWSGGGDHSVTLAFTNSTSNTGREGWSWRYEPPASPVITAPIPLRIKTTVKRPPTEDRLAAH